MHASGIVVWKEMAPTLAFVHLWRQEQVVGNNMLNKKWVCCDSHSLDVCHYYDRNDKLAWFTRNRFLCIKFFANAYHTNTKLEEKHIQYIYFFQQYK